MQGQRMNLLERTASVGAMPDLGLPKSHTAAGNLQVLQQATYLPAVDMTGDYKSAALLSKLGDGVTMLGAT
jgi:hypothetical protein